MWQDQNKWQSDWTPEHAGRMAEQFDRLKLLHDTYKRHVPEGEDVWEHIRTRADKLGVGRGIPLLQTAIGMGAGAAASAVVPYSGAVAGPMAEKYAGDSIKRIDRKLKTDNLRKFLSDKK